jgi:lipoprotein-anchoring transpeptidase ErfK/SrfK
VLRRSIVLVAFAALACAAAPGASRMPAIAPGVAVLSVPVAGLTSEPARIQLERELGRSISIERGSRRWWASPARLGANVDTDLAVSAALAARPGERFALYVDWSSDDLRRFVAGVSRAVNRKPVDAQLVQIRAGRPVIRAEKAGLRVRQVALRRAIEARLNTGSRKPISLPVRVLPAKVTKSKFGPAIWINRRTNTLRLYNATKLVRRFGVATGQARYPTPSGLFSIVDMQYNPWWTPPPSDWARGLKPVPPGPGNPLGTRWMGLSISGVGIHGTPDAASIGYSASHGCIRMQIPDAEWLFAHVRPGTPVYIT